MQQLCRNVLVLGCVAASFLTGCSTQTDRSVEPMTLRSPYQAASAVVWAVVPVNNESGTSAVDELALTDKLVQSLREVRGITSVSTNRTITAIEALELDTVRTPGEALALAEVLGVDAVVLPTLTSWDPYDPPRVGLDVDVYARSRSMGTPEDPTDPFTLARAASDRSGDSWDATRPIAAISIELDGSNGAVRAAVRAFAEGRADPTSATGWLGYIRSMDRFETFAAFQSVQALLQAEAVRVGMSPYDVTLVREREWWE